MINQQRHSKSEFYKYLEQVRKARSDSYQAVFHLDGAQENLVQLYGLKNIFHINPLTITFNNHCYTNSQKRNIKKALELIDVDNIMYTPRISVVRKLFELYPCHVETFFKQGRISLLLRIVSKYRIPLLICDSDSTVRNIDEILRCCDSLFLGDSPFLNVEEFVCERLSRFDFAPYRLPRLTDSEKQNLNTISLDGYVECRDEQIQEFLAKFDWSDEKVEEDSHFWLGYPDEWARVVKESAQSTRIESRYEKLARLSEHGKPLFSSEIQYCNRCCMPVTAENLELDELGMCQPCLSSEQKMHINWLERQAMLKNILDHYRQIDYYDCIVPISGGKDSTYQLYTITQVYRKKVLAVTFSHNWFSKTGRYNLMNAIKRFDVDHIMFTPRRRAVNKLARKSLSMIGDACWHCHAGVGAFPLQVAVKFGVKLLIWGESVAECDGRATYDNPIVFDRDYFTKISARYYAEEMVDDEITTLDIQPYILPGYEEIEEQQVRGIHLGDYMFWDDERQMEFVRNHFGWREHTIEGAYKGYKSVECVMAGIHDYTKFIKRGFGRGTDQASQDVRNGLLTREEGFDLAKQYDTARPPTLDYFLFITGFTEEDMEQTLKLNRENEAKNLP